MIYRVYFDPTRTVFWEFWEFWGHNTQPDDYRWVFKAGFRARPGLSSESVHEWISTIINHLPYSWTAANYVLCPQN